MVSTRAPRRPTPTASACGANGTGLCTTGLSASSAGTKRASRSSDRADRDRAQKPEHQRHRLGRVITEPRKQARRQMRCRNRRHEPRARRSPERGGRQLLDPPRTPPGKRSPRHAQRTRKTGARWHWLRMPGRGKNHRERHVQTPSQEANRRRRRATTAPAATKTQPRFELGANLSGAAPRLARIVRPVQSASAPTTAPARLVGQFLVNTPQ